MPTVAIGFNWKRATPLAANVAIVCGLATNFVIELWLKEHVPHELVLSPLIP